MNMVWSSLIRNVDIKVKWPQREHLASFEGEERKNRFRECVNRRPKWGEMQFVI